MGWSTAMGTVGQVNESLQRWQIDAAAYVGMLPFRAPASSAPPYNT
jgi:hypothetical protein